MYYIAFGTKRICKSTSNETKYKAKIDKIAIKILPRVKKKEAERFKKMKQSSTPPAGR